MMPVNEINRRLLDVEERQVKNKQALVKLEQFEEQYSELGLRETRLFDWLFDVWSQDEELRDSIEQDQKELAHIKWQITSEINDKKLELLKEKRDLWDAEEVLYFLRRSMNQEEKR